MQNKLKQTCIIVQSNMEVLLNVDSELHNEARDAIAPFTELVKSPEHFHTYSITHLSLWNAASTGLSAGHVLQRLRNYSSFEIPSPVITEITEYMDRYGVLRLVKRDERLVLECDNHILLFELCTRKEIEPYISEIISRGAVAVNPLVRGKLKIVLTEVGFPVQDLAGYVEGTPLNIELRETIKDTDEPFVLRDYQRNAAQVFYSSGSEKGGSGVVVLPCGSGKTVIGITAMSLVKAHTLILSPNVTSARQWIREILSKTNLTSEQVKEYSGDLKEIGDVTVATYQILTQRKRSAVKKEDKDLANTNIDDEFTNFSLFEQKKWGLMIYDEVHLLPAPVFRFSADMQATRRLGLTATLIREDRKETEVFALIGPKKFDLPWKILEAQGWIAQATCYEIRVPMDFEMKMQYAVAPVREKIIISSCNPRKTDTVLKLLEEHNDKTDRILIIGQYLDQLKDIAEKVSSPVITGKTPNKERESIYQQFRNGDLKILTISKVGNFAVDLPDANILIQISGTFGSRQEEAQRLGRVLRPKKDGRPAKFFSVVTKDSREQEFAMNRQLFLAEQGYSYKVIQEET